MNRELEKKLSEEFPFMIARNVWSGEICTDENGETFGFPCSFSDGWYTIVHDLCQELTELYNTNEVDPNCIEIMQIKEKFGSLRFYTGGLIKGGNEIISKYEYKSLETCEVCGDVGDLCIRGNWYRTLCDKHRDEMHYKSID